MSGIWEDAAANVIRQKHDERLTARGQGSRNAYLGKGHVFNTDPISTQQSISQLTSPHCPRKGYHQSELVVTSDQVVL